jgi:hypothetical protein
MKSNPDKQWTDASKQGWIVTVGIALIAIIAVSIFLVMLLATLDGRGAIPIGGMRGGKPVLFIPIAYLVFFGFASIIGVVWVFQRMRKRKDEPTSKNRKARKNI